MDLPLRAQSKYGLMGSGAKTGKFFIGGSRSKKDVLFWVQNPPPTYTSNLDMCAGGFIRMDLFKSYCNSIWVSLATTGDLFKLVHFRTYPHVPALSSGGC